MFTFSFWKLDVFIKSALYYQRCIVTKISYIRISMYKGEEVAFRPVPRPLGDSCIGGRRAESPVGRRAESPGGTQAESPGDRRQCWCSLHPSVLLMQKINHLKRNNRWYKRSKTIEILHFSNLTKHLFCYNFISQLWLLVIGPHWFFLYQAYIYLLQQRQ